MSNWARIRKNDGTLQYIVNLVEQLKNFVELSDQLEVCLPCFRLLTGVQKLA